MASCSNTFEKLGFPLRNTRWSWGAKHEEHKAVMLRVWQHEIVKLETLKIITPTDLPSNTFCSLIYNHSYHIATDTVNDLGTVERREHIKLIQQGYNAFGICVISNKNSEADWEYTIKSHDSRQVYALNKLLEVSTDDPDITSYYISIAKKIPANKFKNVGLES